MTTTLSIRLQVETKKRLEALAKSSKRSKSFLAEEAIASYVSFEERLLDEISAGLADLNAGRTVSHDKVSEWLQSWGKPGEAKKPK